MLKKWGLRVTTLKFRVEADLHCHTTASDGLLTPQELVRQAALAELKGVGITDHDTLSGWEEAEATGRECGLEILKGIELNTEVNGIEIHILGYEPEFEAKVLQEKLSFLRGARYKRMLDMIGRLNSLDVRVRAEDVEKFAHGESIGRPHVAQALIESGYAHSLKDAFTRYIGYGAPAYVPRYKLTPAEAIKVVRQAGGVAVLAHPGIQRLEGSLKEWVDQGLQGLEVSHSDHSGEDEARYRKLALEYGLVPTGGSDFHGEKRKPGVKLGGWGTSLDTVFVIRDLARRNRIKTTS